MTDLPKITGKKFTAGQVADLPGPHHLVACDLSRLDLRPADLSGFFFDASDLSNSKIRKAVGAKFYSCDLTNLDCTNADITFIETLNCKASGLDFTGANLTFDCHTMFGLKSSRASDAFKLIYWATILDNPASKKLREFLSEPEVMKALDFSPGQKAILDKAFERNPR